MNARTNLLVGAAQQPLEDNVNTASKRVRETAIRLFGPEVGCADGGCIFGHLGGMHTNGGCQCRKDARHNEAALAVALSRLSKLAYTLAGGKTL